MNRTRLINSIACIMLSLMVSVSLLVPLKSIAQSPAGARAAETTTAEVTVDPSDAIDQQQLNAMIEDFTNMGSGPPILIPVLAVVFIFGGPIAILITLVLQHYRSQKRLAELRRECIGKLIDAGKDVPDTLLYFDNLGNDQAPERDLRRGLKNLGLGIGIAIFLTAVSSVKAGTFGLILVGLGCAQLLSWKFGRAAN